ncbi:MAG: hypothetical protein QM817_24565 [Archangium sp.]
MTERTSGGLFLPDAEALALEPGPMPPFAKPVEPPAEGLVLACGFASPFLITDPENWWAELHDARVHVFAGEVSIDQLISPLEEAAREARAVLIVAPVISVPARQFIVINKLRGIINASAIETTRGGELGSHVKRVRSGRTTTCVIAA